MESLIEALLGLIRAKRPRNRTEAIVKYFKRVKQEEVEKLISHKANILDANITASIVLERIFQEIRRSVISRPTAELYKILADVCRVNFDLASEIQYVRYALQVLPQDRKLKQRLAATLVKHGIELMSIAARNNHDQTIYNRAASQFSEATLYDKENSAVYANKAICHIYQNELPKALEMMDRAVAFNLESRDTNTDNSQNGDNNEGDNAAIDLYILRGKLYQISGQMERCLQDFRIATSLNSQHPEVLEFNIRTITLTDQYYHKGMHYFHQNDYINAIKYLKEALLISPEDMKLLIMLARLHRITDSIFPAYDYIQRATMIYDTCTESLVPPPYDLQHQKNLIYNDFALNHVKTGDYIQAIALLSQVITSEENLSNRYDEVMDYHFYINRGDCYRGIEQYSSAIGDYNLANLLYPNDWELMTRLSISNYALGVELFNEGSYVEADQVLTESIRYNPKVFEYYLLRGRSRYYQGDYEGAKLDYKESYRLNPTSIEVQRYYYQFVSQEVDIGVPGTVETIKPLIVTTAVNLPPLISMNNMPLLKTSKEINIHQKRNKLKNNRIGNRSEGYVELQEKKLLVESIRSTDFDKEGKSVWKPQKINISNASSSTTSNALMSIDRQQQQQQQPSATISSATQLRERSKKQTMLALKHPGALLSGIRTTKHDALYKETKPGSIMLNRKSTNTNQY